MSTKQDDFIILASNVKTFGETNTISNFKTKLARRRDFPSNEDWRVALTEITYKQTWYNLQENVIPAFYTQQAVEISLGIDMKISRGFYATAEGLIGEINKMMQLLDNEENEPPFYWINYSTQLVSITPGVRRKTGVKYIPTLGTEIETMLGFTDERGGNLCDRLMYQAVYTAIDLADSDDMYNYITKSNEELANMFEQNKITATFPPDLKNGLNNLFIYTNIVQQSDVGDAFVPILTTVPNKLSQDGWGGSVHHEPKNLIYRPLQTRNFDTIEIDVKDDSGRKFPFKIGNVIIKLHFLKHG